MNFSTDDVRTAGGKSAFGIDQLYTGQSFDAETGMHYYKNRYYLAEIGRFMTRDLIGVWGDYYNFGNGYAYVGNNTIYYTDRYGLAGGGPGGFSGCYENCKGGCDERFNPRQRARGSGYRQCLDGCRENCKQGFQRDSDGIIGAELCSEDTYKCCTKIARKQLQIRLRRAEDTFLSCVSNASESGIRTAITGAAAATIVFSVAIVTRGKGAPLLPPCTLYGTGLMASAGGGVALGAQQLENCEKNYRATKGNSWEDFWIEMWECN